MSGLPPSSPSNLSHRTARSRSHFPHPHSAAEPDFLPDPSVPLAEGLVVGEQEEEGGAEEALLDDDEVEDAEEELDEDDEWDSRPWYRRASPWWVIPAVLVSSTLNSMTSAPKVEVYNKLVCAEHRPEYSSHPVPYPPPPQSPEAEVGVGPPLEGEGKVEMLWGREDWRWEPEYAVDQAAPGPVKPPSALCRADPVVQSEVAKISTAMMTIMGILAVLTTGWWTSLSDIHGRTKILALSIFGVLITDANFLLTAHLSSYLPGGYRFLIVGPLIDGLMGGYPTATAATHAYIGDCTPPHARARMFSLNAGLAFVGIALGPTAGALVIRATGDLLSVFYITTAGHVIYAIAIICIIPESLSPQAKKRIARRTKERAREEEEREVSLSQLGSRVRLAHGAWRAVRPLFGFLSPLMMFAPRRYGGGGADGSFAASGIVEMGRVSGGGMGKREWNLTFFAACYGIAGMLIGLYTFKFQYAQQSFLWDTQKLGYWLTTVGAVRAFHLMVTLPIILRFLRPKPRQAIALSQSTDNLAQPTTSDPAESPLPPTTADPARAALAAASVSASRTARTAAAHDPVAVWFDLRVARASLFVELLCEVGQALAPGPRSWVLATLVGSLGGGFGPAMQSLALGLIRTTDETGRLFGALSVVGALCTQVLGPAIFGTVFATTVRVFPKAIFVVASLCVGTAVICLFCIRLPRPEPPPMVILASTPPRGQSALVEDDEDDEETVLLGQESARRAVEGEPPRGRTMSRGNVRAKVVL